MSEEYSKREYHAVGITTHYLSVADCPMAHVYRKDAMHALQYLADFAEESLLPRTSHGMHGEV